MHPNRARRGWQGAARHGPAGQRPAAAGRGPATAPKRVVLAARFLSYCSFDPQSHAAAPFADVNCGSIIEFVLGAAHLSPFFGNSKVDAA
jgi:hypothetical protein